MRGLVGLFLALCLSVDVQSSTVDIERVVVPAVNELVAAVSHGQIRASLRLADATGFSKSPTQLYQRPYTCAGGDGCKNRHRPLGISVAEKLVIIKAGGGEFLFILLGCFCVGGATFVMLDFVSRPKPRDRNKNDRPNKEP